MEDKIVKIVTRISQKRDLLLEEMADEHLMTLKIHANHSTNETFKTAVKILLMRFYNEMEKAIENTKAEEYAR